jgi:hypothetical protein
MSDSIVDHLFREFQEIVKFLEAQKESSFKITTEDNFRKTLLLTAASYFEDRIRTHISNLVSAASKNNELVVELIKKKVTDSRQYHTLFAWEKSNANHFFSQFGKGFKEYMEKQIDSNEELDESIKAFMEIGSARNRLVHENFGTFPLEKTTEEIYASYNKALIFVESVPNKFIEYEQTK